VLLVLPHIDVAGRQAAIPNLRENQFWFWTYLVNIWSAITPLHSDLAIVHSHFWSLAVEEQFYLVWPAVVLVFGRRRLMGVCAALAAGALVLRFFLTSDAAGSFAQLNAAHVLMPARMDTLALGAFIALAVRGSGEMARLVRWAPIVAGAALLALVALFVAEDGLTPLDHRVATIGLSLLALLFAALLVMAVSAPPKALLHRLFAHPALRFAGRYAYALYVFHLLIAFDLAVVWNEHGLVRTVAGSQLPANLVFSAAGTSIALMLAWLSWHLYEKQFLKLKRFVPYGRGGERARAPRERAPLAAEPSSIPAP
jgi:peptidoglycan/LPS O-acetylase OafA/YrhL